MGNISGVDDDLIAEAMRLGKFSSKVSAANAALAEFVNRRKQVAILELAGKITYYPDYDYKRLRGRKRL